MNQVKIKEQIKILLHLQEIDSRRFELKEDQRTFPEQLQKLEDEFSAKSAALKEHDETLKLLQLKQKEKDISLGKIEEDIQKKQTQLFQLKTNKEYQAMVFEIEGMKADKSVIEEEILNIMDEIEQAQKAIEQEKQKLAQEKAKLEEEKARVKKELQSIEQEIKTLDEKRTEISREVAPDILQQYEKILEHTNGLAVVSVSGEICGGCHMNLPPQLINEVHLGEKLIFCQSCCRILYNKGSETNE